MADVTDPQQRDEGERDFLASVIERNRWSPVGSSGVVRRTGPFGLADAILEAGFTRRRDQGETVDLDNLADWLRTFIGDRAQYWPCKYQTAEIIETIGKSFIDRLDEVEAERDALAAKLADINNTIAEVDMGEIRALNAALDKSEARALKLLDALQHIASHRLLNHEVVPYASKALQDVDNPPRLAADTAEKEKSE